MKKLFFPLMIAALGVCALASRMLVPEANAAVPVQILYGTTETKDWGSLVDAAGASEDVVVEGAVLGDFCLASQSVDVVDMVVSCSVTAAGVATVRMQNESGSTVDLASSSLRVIVFKKPPTGRGS